MCRGLTSEKGKIIDIEKGKMIVVGVEGKKHAIAVGKTAMSSEDIKNINKDVGI